MIYILYKLPSLYCIILNVLQIHVSKFESQIFLRSVSAMLCWVYDISYIVCNTIELERKMWKDTL